MTPAKGETIAVWFSCGAASAVAAKETLRLYSDCFVRIINNPVAEEDADNQRFLHDVERWLGVEIEIASNSGWPTNSCVDVWAKRKYMAGIGGAPCTYELKKKARHEWENKNSHDWLVLGFTADERPRADRFRLTERDRLLTPLIDLGYNKDRCFAMIEQAGIKLPAAYRMGYPNANCVGCVKATSPTYWNHVRQQHPEVFEQRAEQSRELGARLVRHQNKRIFLDELPSDATGRSMKNMSFECGLFCEEKA